MTDHPQPVYRMKGVTLKLLLLAFALVLWVIAAILVLVSDSLGSFGAVDFLILGAPFFAASFLPLPLPTSAY